MTFDGRSFVGLLGQRGKRPGLMRDVLDAFQRVGEKNVHALVALKMVGPRLAPEFGQMASAQFEADLEMRDGIRRHEQFKTEKAREQMFVNVGGPKPGLMFLLEAFADLFDDLEEKRAGAGGGIEDEHAMRFLLDFLFAFLAREIEFDFVGEAVL